MCVTKTRCQNIADGKLLSFTPLSKDENKWSDLSSNSPENLVNGPFYSWAQCDISNSFHLKTRFRYYQNIKLDFLNKGYYLTKSSGGYKLKGGYKKNL